MKTLAVICIALTRQSPSLTPLARTSDATWPVMLIKPILPGTLNVRYLVCDFIQKPLRPSTQYLPRFVLGQFARHLTHSCDLLEDRLLFRNQPQKISPAREIKRQ